MTKIFFDTEFTGLHQGTTLVSIGLIAETGETFYAELTDYDPDQLNDWLVENVIDKLYLKDRIGPTSDSWENWASDKGNYDNALDFTVAKKDMRHFECAGKTGFVSDRLRQWLSQFDTVEMWSDCLSYDWVLFCELFDGAFGIPKNVYYIPFDICTLFKQKGIDPDINREDFSKEILTKENFQSGPKHNAYWDATVIKACYEKLQ